MGAASLRIKIFADGANLDDIRRLAEDSRIQGFTTNPTLMRAAGVKDYAEFARDAVAAVGGRPISFEIFADDFDSMESQAQEIATWGPNVYVKIPVTNSTGEFAGPVISSLSGAGIKVNVTAVMTLEQVEDIALALSPDVPAVVSVFAGRIADTGIDPVPHMEAALERLGMRPKAELLWASPRELLNVFQADAIGCHIITATVGVLKKLDLVGKDLRDYSLETVQMFLRDATKAGYSIASGGSATTRRAE